MMKKTRVLLAIATATFLCLALLPVVTPVAPAQAQVPWARSADNPVLPFSDQETDWDYGGVGAACVILDGSTYKMWYTGISNASELAIGYVESDNGTTWTTNRQKVTWLNLPEAWEEDGVGSPCVIWDADVSRYKMWYTGYTDAGGSNIPAIGYATSTDGINWTKDTANNPVLEGTSGQWDEDGVMSPSVIKEATDTYKMWYTGRIDDDQDAVGSIQVGYATSTNGTSWTKDTGNNPVLAKGDPGDWDDRGVGVGCVALIGTTYHMWYTGYEGSGELTIELGIGHVESSDGTSWINRSQELTEGTGWETNGFGAPWVVFAYPWYYMWYSGLNSSWEPQLGLAQYRIPTGGGGGGFGGGADTTPPRIYNVTISDITETAADIAWTTNEWSTSQVEYRASPTMVTPPTGTMSIQHMVPLTDLTPGTAYYFKMLSTDRSDNQAVSDEYSFTTLGTPPVPQVSALEIAPDPVDIGEEVTISVLVLNPSDASRSYEVSLRIDDVAVATEKVTLAGGASQRITFTTSQDVAKTYSVSVDGLSSSFTVKEAVAPPPPPPPPVVPPPPVTPPAPAVNWWLIGGIIAAVVAASVVIWLTVVRQRAV